MGVAHTLGQFTGVKHAGIAGLVGQGIDKAFMGGAKLLGKGFTAKGILPKVLTGAGAVTGAGAINEGLSYASNNQLGKSLDQDPTWSPNAQFARQRNHRNIFDHLAGFAKRPIQSMFGSSQPPSDWRDLIQNQGIPKSVKTQIKGFDPQGNPIYDFSGSGAVEIPGSVRDLLNNQRQDNQLFKDMGFMTGQSNGSTPTPSKPSYHFADKPNFDRMSTS